MFESVSPCGIGVLAPKQERLHYSQDRGHSGSSALVEGQPLYQIGFLSHSCMTLQELCNDLDELTPGFPACLVHVSTGSSEMMSVILAN